MNLCVNARDAMPDGGALHHQHERSDPERSRGGRSFEDALLRTLLLIAVSDTGTGMSQKIMEHAFERRSSRQAFRPGRRSRPEPDVSMASVRQSGGIVQMQTGRRQGQRCACTGRPRCSARMSKSTALAPADHHARRGRRDRPRVTAGASEGTGLSRTRGRQRSRGAAAAACRRAFPIC